MGEKGVKGFPTEKATVAKKRVKECVFQWGVKGMGGCIQWNK